MLSTAAVLVLLLPFAIVFVCSWLFGDEILLVLLALLFFFLLFFNGVLVIVEASHTALL